MASSGRNGTDNTVNGEQPDRESKFSAYSNYRSVTESVSAAIDNAGDAYAYASARKAEGKGLKSGDAIRLRRYMKKAALMLLPELRANEQADVVYQEILARWEDDGTAGGVAPEGAEWPPYLQGIERVQLRGREPLEPWIEQFVMDIRRAGWEIGHLQAGETTQTESLDPAEDQANAMLRD